jgi:hypothetical protein
MRDILIANDAGNDFRIEQYAEDNGNPNPGVVCMANTSRFVEAFFSEPLTTYATGWRDQEGLQQLIDFIAPPTEVPRRFEYRTFPNVEAFVTETDDVRAIGADFKRVEYTSDKATGTTKNKGLTIRIDLDNVDQNTNWRERTVAKLQERILRNEVRRAITLLSAAATNTAKTWDTSSGKDPDQDVLNEVISYVGAAGVPPSNVLYDLTAWSKRILAHRAQNLAGGFASAGITVDQVAQFVGVQRGMVARHMYQSSPTAKLGILGGNRVLVFLANPNQSIDDPSNIKRFVTQTMGGTMVRVYEQQVTMKLVDITVEIYSDTVITSTLGVRQLTIS